MLEAGGLPPLTDRIRVADQNNLRGYYELEAVKRTREDASWLDNATGRCVKVVSLLLYDLPMDRPYNVIFMIRSMDEILASQAAMLKHRNKEDGRSDVAMRLHFEAHLLRLERRLAEQCNVNVLYCDYDVLIRSPEQQAHAIQNFLDIKMDIAAMVSVVDPALYRQRKEQDHVTPDAG